MKTIKKCPSCGIEKKLDEFNRSKERIFSWCKKCLYKNQSERWIQRKIDAIQLMGGKCCKCGYCKNYTALEFHHINPKEKDYNWTKTRQLAWKDIIVELKKCVLVCANCHRETHFPEAILDLSKSKKGNPLLRKELVSSGSCPICKTNVYGTKYCSVGCSAFSKRKIKRPTKKQDIDNMSYCAVGKKYGVSDNAIRKWMKQYK